MAYGSDVTEGLPYALSNPTGSINYSGSGESYDIGINGLPFFLYTNDEFPYRRQTAQYRKQQIDQSSEPGEQSITGWWVRSQSSFHKGDGIRFYDPSAGEVVAHRFADSKGVNVWDKGRVTLLNSCDVGHITTGSIPTSGIAKGKTSQHLRSIQWAGINGALLRDEYDVDKVFPTITASISNKALTSNVATLTTSATHSFTAGMEITVSGVDATFNGNYTITAVTTNTFSYAKTATNVTSTAVSPVGTVTSNVINFIDYNSGTAFPVYAICDDGVNAYWITNSVSGGSKLAMYKKPLTGSSASTADETNMFTHASIVVANAAMEYVKERIIACINNAIYEIPTTSTSLPSTALYTHPSTSQIYTSVTASGPAVYVSGYNGIQSTIQKFTLVSSGSTAGTLLALSSAATAAEMPVGEIIHKIYYYLGRMIIGTNKGIRVATVSDQDGSISYGPIIVETSQPVYDFASRDKYVWCATSVDGEPGTIRIDLGSEIEQLRFSFANDLYYPGVTGHATTACAFAGDSSQLMYATAYASSINGNVYCQNMTTMMPTGSITTGAIRYATLENKVFKTLKARIDNTNGGLKVESIDTVNQAYVIGNFAEGDFTPEMNISYPAGAQEYMSFRFTLSRLSTDATKGPIFSGYQLKALPSIPRQRLIQYPLSLFDHEQDALGVQVGHEGSAYDRLGELEALENTGDTIRVEDFRTGESYLGIIEELQFINRTPTDKRFSGFGGILQLTIRTI